MIKISKYYEGYDTQSYGCNISLPINLGFFGGKGRIGIIQNLSQTSTFLFLCADDANYAESVLTQFFAKCLKIILCHKLITMLMASLVSNITNIKQIV